MTSKELIQFYREKLLELAFEKDQPSEEEKFNFFFIKPTKGLKELEENKNDIQDQKMKQKDLLLSTLDEIKMSISKMAQLDTLYLLENTIKRKRGQFKETGIIIRHLSQT